MIAAIAVLLLAGGATAVEGATEHAPALLLRALIAVVVVVSWAKGARRPLLRDVVAPGFALAVVAVGLPLAPSLGFALQPLITVGLVCALYVALLTAERDVWQWVLPISVGVGAVHGVGAILQVVAGAQRGSGGFFNSIDLAAFLAPLLVLTLAAVLRDEHQRWWLAAGICLLAGLLSTSSRGGLVAAAAGTAVVAIGHSAAALRQRLHLVILGGALGTVSIAALLALTWWRWSGANDPYSYSRLMIWKRTAEVAIEHPVGVGLANYAHAMRVAGVPIDGPVRYPKVAKHAHSEPLNAWAELGWLGLIATLLPVAMLLRALRSAPSDAESRPADRPMPYVHLGVLVALGIPAMVSASLHVPPVAFFAAAWAAKLARDRDCDEGDGAQRVELPARGRALAAVFVASLVLLAVPGTISTVTMKAAAERRDAGDLPGAVQLAQVSTAAAPWSVGAAMMFESLLYRLGRPAIQSSEALVELADRFPSSAKPLARAAWVLEQEAARVDHDADVDADVLWRTAAAVRRLAVERDPNNGIGWHALALAERAAGDIEAAAITVDRALRVEPRCAGALALAAALKHRAGDTAGARHLANSAWAANALAAGAEGYAAQVLSLNPDSHRMLIALGLGSE